MAYDYYVEKEFICDEARKDKKGLYIYADNPEHNSDNPSTVVRYLQNAKPISIMCAGKWPVNDSNIDSIIRQLQSDIDDIYDAWMLNDYDHLYYPLGGYKIFPDFCLKEETVPLIRERYVAKMKELLSKLGGVKNEDRIIFIKERLNAYAKQTIKNSKEEFLQENRKNLTRFLGKVASRTPDEYRGIIATVYDRIKPGTYCLVNLTDKEANAIALSAIKYSYNNSLPNPDKFRNEYRQWANG